MLALPGDGSRQRPEEPVAARVRLSTIIHLAKGLELRAVIVSALDQLPNPHRADEVRDSNLFYDGLKWALEQLAVTWVGQNDFADRVRRPNKVNLFPW